MTTALQTRSLHKVSLDDSQSAAEYRVSISNHFALPVDEFSVEDVMITSEVLKEVLMSSDLMAIVLRTSPC